MNSVEAWQRGATPHPRSGWAIESARPRQRGAARGASPHLRSGAVAAERNYPTSGSGALPERRNPTSKRGGCRAQEGREELLHGQGQEERP